MTELAKVLKILLELEKCTIGQYAGNKLDDIDVDMEEELQGNSHVLFNPDLL